MAPETKIDTICGRSPQFQKIAFISPDPLLLTFDYFTSKSYHYSQNVAFRQGCGVLVFYGTPTPNLGLIVRHNVCVLKDDLKKIIKFL